MPTDTNQPEPIQVSANQGLVDGLQAVGRYAVVLFGFGTAVAGLCQQA
jgi:hypothetical protein